MIAPTASREYTWSEKAWKACDNNRPLVQKTYKVFLWVFGLYPTIKLTEILSKPFHHIFPQSPLFSIIGKIVLFYSLYLPITSLIDNLLNIPSNFLPSFASYMIGLSTLPFLLFSSYKVFLALSLRQRPPSKTNEEPKGPYQERQLSSQQDNQDPVYTNSTTNEQSCNSSQSLSTQEQSTDQQGGTLSTNSPSLTTAINDNGKLPPEDCSRYYEEPPFLESRAASFQRLISLPSSRQSSGKENVISTNPFDEIPSEDDMARSFILI